MARSKVITLLRMLHREPQQFWRSLTSFIFGYSRLESRQIAAKDWILPEDELRKTLQNHLIARGGSARNRPWKMKAIDLLVARATQNLSHAESTRVLSEISKSIEPGVDLAETYFAFARAARGVGLFEGSYGFTQLAYNHIESAGTSSITLRDKLRAITTAIHSGDLDVALERWEMVQSWDVPDGTTGQTFSVLAEYFSVVRGESGGQEQSEVDERWKETLRGRRVLLSGPAPEADEEDTYQDADFVAQIFRGDATLSAPSEPRANHILYANGPWTSMIAQFEEASLIEALSMYRFFVLKGGAQHTPLPNARSTAIRYSRLFPSGHPNLIPLICIDLLRAGIGSLFVTGVNFYASQNPYRVADTRTLARFHMCTSIGSHNPLENRAIVKNLVDRGLVDGDAQFRNVLAIGNAEYLRLLDDYYGKPQR